MKHDMLSYQYYCINLINYETFERNFSSIKKITLYNQYKFPLKLIENNHYILIL